MLLESQLRMEPEERLSDCVIEVSRMQPTGVSEMVGSE